MPNLEEYYTLLKEEPLPLTEMDIQSLMQKAIEQVEQYPVQTEADSTISAKKIARGLNASSSYMIGAIFLLAISGILLLYFAFQTLILLEQKESQLLSPKLASKSSGITSPITRQESQKQYSLQSHLPNTTSSTNTTLEFSEVMIDINSTQGVKSFQTQTIPEHFPQLQGEIEAISQHQISNSSLLQNTQNNPQHYESKAEYWNNVEKLYRQDLVMLNQLLQNAFAQQHTKTTISQLFSPCSLENALSEKVSTDCLLSIIESHAKRTQDSLLQELVVQAKYALENRLPKPIERTSHSSSAEYHDLPKSILEPKNPDIYSPPNSTGYEYQRIRNLQMNDEKSTSSQPQKDLSNYIYQQRLLVLQSYMGQISDDLEIDSSQAASRFFTTEQVASLSEGMQSPYIPMWFQKILANKRFIYARYLLDSSITQNASEFDIYTLRGNIANKLDSTSAAISDYTQAIRTQESSPLYKKRGLAYFTLNNLEAAYLDFSKSLHFNNRDAESLFMRGATAYNLKRFEEACDDWAKAAELGHPLADSILAEKCMNVLHEHTRKADAEKKKQLLQILFILSNIQHRHLSIQESQISLNGLSYQKFKDCTLENITDPKHSAFSLLHLLYSFSLQLGDAQLIQSTEMLATNLTQSALNIQAPSIIDSSTNGRSNNSDFSKNINDNLASDQSYPYSRTYVQETMKNSRAIFLRTNSNRHTKKNFSSQEQNRQEQNIEKIISAMRDYILGEYKKILEGK